MLKLLTLLAIIIYMTGLAHAGEPFTKQEMREALLAELIDMGAPDDAQISDLSISDQELFRVANESDIDPSLMYRLSNVDYQHTSNRFSAIMNVASKEAEGKSYRLYGKTEVMLDVPVVTRKLFRGDRIAASDVALIQIAQSDVRRQVAASKSELIGMAVTRTIGANQPVALSSIESPRLVQKNEMVPVIYRSKTMELKTYAKALMDGAYNDMIRVRNVDSNKTIVGRVMENGVLEVSPVSSNIGQQAMATEGGYYAK